MNIERRHIADISCNDEATLDVVARVGCMVVSTFQDRLFLYNRVTRQAFEVKADFSGAGLTFEVLL